MVDRYTRATQPWHALLADISIIAYALPFRQPPARAVHSENMMLLQWMKHQAGLKSQQSFGLQRADGLPRVAAGHAAASGGAGWRATPHAARA